MCDLLSQFCHAGDDFHSRIQSRRSLASHTANDGLCVARAELGDDRHQQADFRCDARGRAAGGDGSGLILAFDAELTERMRLVIGDGDGISEKRMMGGTCFFLHGNMIGGADRAKDGMCRFMFRVGKANSDRAAELGAIAPLLLGDRVMPGFYFVDAEGCEDALLHRWLELALANARSLPPK